MLETLIAFAFVSLYLRTYVRLCVQNCRGNGIFVIESNCIDRHSSTCKQRYIVQINQLKGNFSWKQPAQYSSTSRLVKEFDKKSWLIKWVSSSASSKSIGQMKPQFIFQKALESYGKHPSAVIQLRILELELNTRMFLKMFKGKSIRLF